MEAKSKAKIAIRGRGSVKEGKGSSDRAADSNLDEDLHCLIISDNEAHVAVAKKLIHEIIETVCAVYPTQAGGIDTDERGGRLRLCQSRTTT